MKNTNLKSLAIYLTLITVSAVLVSLGILWLSILGCALISVSSPFSSQRQARRIWTFIYLAVLAILLLALALHFGDAFRQERRPLVCWIVVAVGWLWLVMLELRHFWRSPDASPDA